MDGAHSCTGGLGSSGTEQTRKPQKLDASCMRSHVVSQNLKQLKKDARSPALYNRINEHLMTLKYMTKIKVEGLGEYEIEVKNVIDTRTF